jgi:DNA uptake protein ComE-like DNA-binding protein
MCRPSIFLAVAIALTPLVTGIASAFPKSEQATPPKAPASAATSSQAVQAAPLVDVNRASAAELKKLPAIGDAEAAKIVAGRPYKSKTDLVTKNVLTIEVYDRLSKQVVVDHRKPAPKAKT